MMADPLFQFLDAVNIDDSREYIEFQFSDGAGEQKVIQIDFGYIESLAALFQQAFLSATLEDRQGSNRPRQGLGCCPARRCGSPGRGRR